MKNLTILPEGEYTLRLFEVNMYLKGFELFWEIVGAEHEIIICDYIISKTTKAKELFKALNINQFCFEINLEQCLNTTVQCILIRDFDARNLPYLNFHYQKYRGKNEKKSIL